MKLLAALGIASVMLLVPAVATADETATYEPASGPPGTVVNVSNINLCQPPTVAGQIGFGTSLADVHTPPSFTPPTAQITVPNVADGNYVIVLLCGPAAETLPFTVAGSAVPSFTG